MRFKPEIGIGESLKRLILNAKKTRLLNSGKIIIHMYRAFFATQTAWRRSFFAKKLLYFPTARMILVNLRSSILEELNLTIAKTTVVKIGETSAVVPEKINS